jgi:S-adenosylmethionine-diacylglycerol 3-amino-3-carboxypropyl transferase
MNIAFAQVREDPAVELYVLNKLEKDSDILCITSGGCTVLSLLCDNVNKIVAIDVNVQQNYLAELKLALCVHYDDQIYYVKFLQGEYDEEEMQKVFDGLTLSDACRTFWQEHLDVIYAGINRCGKYEEIFRKWAASDFDSKDTFSDENLRAAFGEAAVRHSNEFASHFEHIIQTYKTKYYPARNYFYYQVLRDKYPIIERPVYMKKLDVIANNVDKVKFVCANMMEYLSTCNSESFDMIQLSNITDWMDVDGRTELMKQCKRVLIDGGYIVSRRLNGNYSLHKLVETEFVVDDDAPYDSSEFYKEVVVGSKSKEFS